MLHASRRNPRQRIELRPTLITLALVAAGLASPPLYAGPQGGVVRAGSASIEAQGSQTRIQQSSQRAIIDWRGFDLGAREAVRFEQPSASAATLNRVSGPRSQIDGRIDANGQVFIVNPAGVIFGRNASLDVGALIATTADIADQDFMAGRLAFSLAGDADGEIRNQGLISAAQGGLVALVAPNVRNDGLISARLGRIVLGSGSSFTLDLYGDQLISLAIPEAQAQALLASGTRLEHSGSALADGGTVVLVSAAAGKQALDSVINLSGTVRANSVEQQAGRIVLLGEASRASVSGTLEASGREAGQSGGAIELRAGTLALDGARIDASGNAGGGSIHVGGRWQGQGDGPRARELTVSADSSLAADALAQGAGGEVVLWSDGHTRFEGSVSARGGAHGGDGGRVEVSGKQTLDFLGSVDAAAPAGQGGLLLLDPENLSIGAREAAALSRILRTGTTASLQADRDIAVNAAIDGRGPTSGGGLSLTAGEDIRVNDFILTENGAINFTATTGSIAFAAGKALFAGNAPITLTSGGRLSAGALLTAGTVSLRSTGGAVSIDALVEAGNGDLDVSAATDIEINAPVVNLLSGHHVELEAGGNIAINAQINGLGATTPGGTVTLAAGGDLQINDFVVTANGRVDAEAGGAVSFAAGKAIFAGDSPIAITAGGELAAGSVVTSSTVNLRSTGGAVRILAPVEAGNGDFSVVAATDVRVEAPVVNLQSGGDVALEAGRDIVIAAQINGLGGSAAGGEVILTAGRDIQVNDFVATADGNITLDAGGAVSVLAGKALFAGEAPITVSSGGTLSAGSMLTSAALSLTSTGGAVHIDAPVEAGSGDLRVRAATDVLIDAPVVNLQSGGEVDIVAGNDILVRAQVDGLGASSAGAVSLQAGGDVSIERFIATSLAPVEVSAGGDLTVTASGGVFAASAPVSLSAGATLDLLGPVFSGQSTTLASTGGSVLLQSAFAPGGELRVSAAQDVTVNQPIASLASGSALSIDAGRNLGLNAEINGRGGSPGGSATLRAGGTLAVGAPIATNNGGISLTAGAITGLSGNGLFAGNGAISVLSDSALATGPIATQGPITLATRGGSITIEQPVAGGAGAIRVQSAGSVSIEQPVVFGPGGSLRVSAGQNISTHTVLAGHGNLSLSAVGDIVVNDDLVAESGLLRVSAQSVSFAAGAGLFAPGGSILLSSVDALITGVLESSAGLTVSSAGALTIGEAIGGRSSSASFSAGGDLTVAAAIGNFAAGAGLALESGGNLAVNARIDAIGGGVTLDAGGNVLVNEHIATVDAPITIGAGGTIVHLADGLDSFGAPQTKQLRAGNAAISETAGASLSTGSMVTSGSVSVSSTAGDVNIEVPVYETTGFTQIVAAGDINVNQVVANATTGANLVMQAGGDINVNAKIGPWDRSDATYPTVNRNALPGGAVNLSAAGDINLASEILTFKDTLTGAAAAALTLESTGGTVNLLAPNLKVSSDFGALTVRSAGDLVNGPPQAPADVNLTPTTGYYTRGLLSLISTGGDVTINQWIPDTTGEVLISAADRVQVNQRIYSASGDITLLAGAGGIVQNPAADPNPNANLSTIVLSDIDARLGNLRLEAVGDILPTILRTGSTLTIKSTAGSIIGGEVTLSRDQSTLPGINHGLPDVIELAGFAGIDGFNAKSTPVLSALSAGGSITNLHFDHPSQLLMVAALDIIDPSTGLGSTPRLFAGRDMQLPSVHNSGALIAKAGRDLTIGSAIYPIWATSADLSAGANPFASIAGTTVAGVAVPAWSGPFGAGSVSVGAPGDTVWIEGTGGLVVSATHNITLPRVHVSFNLGSAADTTDARQTTQPLSLTAGNSISIAQIETTGPVTLAATQGNIDIGATIGAHVAPQAPAVGVWNPTDQGVASLSISAANGNINMREARATGSITIAAPNGQVTFVGGANGVETPGARSVTDSDGVVVSNTIDPTNVARLVRPTIVAPVFSVGPTLAGPGAPAMPGALPPGAPGAVLIASATPSSASVSLAEPGTVGGSASAPPGVGVPGSGAPGAAGVGGSTAPGSSGDGFGEIFVAAADQTIPETRDPVRTDTSSRRRDGTDEGADPGAGDPAAEDQGGQDTTESPDSQLASGEPQDEEERRKAKAKAKPAASTYLVFAGGRGDARERDFGRATPLEDSRVRP